MALRNVLLLGGNGFIGGEVLTQILDSETQMNVVLLNRGRSWDWYDKLARISQVYSNIKWNRKQPLSECSELLKVLEELGRFDHVIDFSGYDSQAVKSSLDVLGKHTSLYIYVSTDSVYEVCDKNHTGPTKETDARLPTDRQERKKRKRLDSYGYKKLKCEEVLRKYQVENSQHRGVFQYLILRLADVIGPRDTTGRWWLYQLWTESAFACSLPVYVPSSIQHRCISLVYVKDIASLILRILTAQPSTLAPCLNQAFNLACTEAWTVAELLQNIRNEITARNGSVLIQYSADSSIPQIYPSVDKGPLDIEKAQSLLRWSPTPLNQAVADCVKFYTQAATSSDMKIIQQKKDVYEDLVDDLRVYDEESYNGLLEKLKFLLDIKE